MRLTIAGDRMVLYADGKPLAHATQRTDGDWDVSTWPVPLDRDRTITALTVAELLARGYPVDHPLVAVFLDELA